MISPFLLVQYKILELRFKCSERIKNGCPSLFHSERFSGPPELSSGFIHCGMLNFPEKPGQHRNDLIFGSDLIACLIMARVFERQMPIAIEDWIRLPVLKVLQQNTIDFSQALRWKRKYANAREILQALKRIEVRSITVEGCPFLKAAQFFERTLTILNSGLDNQLLVLFQALGNRDQMVPDFGFKLS
ncbi:MAG: hypothetical protein ABSG41_03125 [Bryobacteraceae bacterium]